METYIECVLCGEEMGIDIDVDSGDDQTLTLNCADCGQPNTVRARFNYHTSSYDLEVYHEASV